MLMQILIVVVVMCLVFWLIQTYLPIPQPVKTIILCVLALILIVWLLNMIGILPGGGWNWTWGPGPRHR